MIVAAITEAFQLRGALTYAVGGGLVGLACYLGLVPFDPDTLRFDGIVRRHLEIMTGAGIVAGLVYWMIAGRNAGAWREPQRPLTPPPPRSHSPATRAMNRTGPVHRAFACRSFWDCCSGFFPNSTPSWRRCFTTGQPDRFL